MEPFLGQIQPVGFNFPPRGWAFCEGQLLAISQNDALFSLLGTTFGGDGRTTFGLPELRGRSIVGVGSGPGLSPIRWGQKGGAENVTLTLPLMPSHNHVSTVRLGSGVANTAAGTGNNLASNAVADTIFNTGAFSGQMANGNVAVGNTGGGQSFGIRSPLLGIYCCIALVGIYPSRN